MSSEARHVAFYRGEATDTEGHRLAEIWSWNDEATISGHTEGVP